MFPESIPQVQLAAVFAAISLLSKQNIKAPSAVFREEGELALIWSNDIHYAELEILPSGNYAWFIRNKVSKAFDGSNASEIVIHSTLIDSVRLWFADINEQQRAIEKAISRSEDQEAIDSGKLTPAQVDYKNGFFRAIELSPAHITGVGVLPKKDVK